MSDWPVATKVCSKCGKEKQLEEFHKAKKGKYGRAAICKACRHLHYLKNETELKAKSHCYYHTNKELIAQKQHDYYIVHRDERTAYNQQYYQAHRDKLLEYQRRYRTENPEWVRNHWDEWEREHPEKKQQSQRQGKLRRRAREQNSYTRLGDEYLAWIATSHCFLCGTSENLELGHDIPVGPNGPTIEANTFPICRSCNASMGRQTLADILEQKQLFERGTNYAI